MSDEKKVSTKGSRKSLETAKTTWQFIKDDFAEGHAHKEAGNPCSIRRVPGRRRLVARVGISHGDDGMRPGGVPKRGPGSGRIRPHRVRL